MNDSIDRVIEEWEALACAHGVSRKSYGDVEFRRVAGLAHTAAAAWAPNAAPYILGIIGPDSDRGAQFRKGTLADLRAALGLPAWVAPPAPWSDDSELGRVERAEAAEGALTIRLNPKAAESVPGTDWQVDYPGQHSSHQNAQAAWIEAGIVLGVLDDGEGVAGLTRELLTRVEQIEALLVKRAQELEEVRKQLRQTEMAEAAEANTQTLAAAPYEQVERLLQQAASLKRERDAARLRVGELEWEAGRREMELEQVRGWSRSSAHALNAARVLVAEALRMMDAREELDEAKGRFARAHAAYREAEEVCDDEQP